MQENWLQKCAVLAVYILFIHGHRSIAGGLFTRGIAHPQAPRNPGALLLQTCMCEQAQQSFPPSLLRGKHLGMGTKAGCNWGFDKHRTCFCGYWMSLMCL